jgi:hypothetical protein
MNNNNSSIENIHMENDNNNVDLEIIKGKPDKEIYTKSKSNNSKVKKYQSLILINFKKLVENKLIFLNKKQHK